MKEILMTLPQKHHYLLIGHSFTLSQIFNSMHTSCCDNQVLSTLPIKQPCHNRVCNGPDLKSALFTCLSSLLHSLSQLSTVGHKTCPQPLQLHIRYAWLLKELLMRLQVGTYFDSKEPSVALLTGTYRMSRSSGGMLTTNILGCRLSSCLTTCDVICSPKYR